MINKQILPESFDFGVPSVEMIDTYSKGLHKEAMEKRASADAFADVIAELKPKKNRVYLHVITTGAMEKYKSNRNGDSYNEDYMKYEIPFPEDSKKKTIDLDGGLKKYHDSSYMKGGAVYQEHKTKDTEPSGEVIAAKYNDDMHRGELIIAVDTEKWAPRLQRKAQGKDIYLSIGCQVPRDVCTVCGHQAKTMKEHCDHFKHHRLQVYDDGTQSSVINDTPKFYDISGVDVPADKIAFVLRKVASGELVKEASAEAYMTYGTRVPMLFTKSAAILQKLSRMEKKIDAMVEGDSKDSDEEFKDDEDAQKDFILRVENYPADEIIDATNRKGILLSPGMLFRILGKDATSPEDKMVLEECDDDCCGDCSAMMRELEDDDESRNEELLDGSFDSHFVPDINLENILDAFMPEFGMKNPEVQSRSIHIIITGRKPSKGQRKEASFNKYAQDTLRRTYARYVISFAAQNDDATCMNALRKIANYGK